MKNEEKIFDFENSENIIKRILILIVIMRRVLIIPILIPVVISIMLLIPTCSNGAKFTFSQQPLFRCSQIGNVGGGGSDKYNNSHQEEKRASLREIQVDNFIKNNIEEPRHQ